MEERQKRRHARRWYKKRTILVCDVQKRTVGMSPICLALYFDRDPAELQIDHIDQNKQNNNIGNLRLATSASNCHNRQLTPAIKKKKTSKYKGVYWHKPRNKWRARIVVNGKPKELGRFHKEEDAAKVYDLAAKQFYGQFAVLNFKDPLIILA